MLSKGSVTLLLFITVVGKLLYASETQTRLRPEDLYQRLAPSVVTILVFDRSGSQTGSGSGVVVASDGVVLTNHHVVEGGTFYDVRVVDAKGTVQTFQARPFKADKQRDLAMIRIAPPAPLLPVDIAKDAPKAGTKVFAIGSPFALEGSISEGIVSQLRTDGDAVFIQTTAAISPGSSGGGLFLETGKLVGVTTASLLMGQNLNFAVSCSDLSTLKPVASFAAQKATQSESAIRPSVTMAAARLTLGMPKAQVLAKFDARYKIEELGGDPNNIVVSERVGENHELRGSLGFTDGNLSWASVTWPAGNSADSMASTLHDVLSMNISGSSEIVIVSATTQNVPGYRIDATEFTLPNGKAISVTVFTHKGETSTTVQETIAQ